MSGTISKLAGPVALGSYTDNIYNEPSTQLYTVITHIRVNNTTNGPLTFRTFKGATGANAAGTNFTPVDYNVPANDFKEFFMQNRFESTDFLVGGASGAGLVIIVEGYKAVK